jgi:hypothetical protein
MAELKSYFTDFLAKIRLSPDQVTELKEAHSELRERLEEHETVSALLVSTFLQGSYKRATIVRPAVDKKADVDVIVVTNIDRNTQTPEQALRKFQGFLNSHYPGRWGLQGRSIGIELATVELDVVITSAPSETDRKALRFESIRSSASLEDAGDLRLNEFWVPPERRGMLESQSRMWKAAREPEWKTEPLWIPDREAKCWQQTHPLEQIRITRDKNAQTEGNFINVVKALKWWRRVQDPEAEQPKSYPLERIFWECCPDSIRSVACGVVETLEQMVVRFQFEAAAGRTPVLRDHGTGQDVLKRISGEQFGRFYDLARKAAVIAREAFDEEDNRKSARRWGDLFGEEFPASPEGGENGPKGGSASGGYSERGGPTIPGTGRFA